MVCPRCAKENDPENLYCSRCGLEFAKVAKDPQPTADTMFCHWHPKTPTSLTCGKCERPICTKCMINGPAGIRCKECGRTKIKVTARGIAHDTTRPIMQTLGSLARQPFGIFIILMLLSGLVRGGCMMMGDRSGPDPYYDEAPAPRERRDDPQP